MSALAASLRPALAQDVPVLAAIAEAAILELTGDDYSEDQQEAWIAAAADEAALAGRVSSHLTLVAERGGVPVGFVSVADNRVIDLLYVHPEAAGEGVGALLCDAAERLATARGSKSLTADASDNALGFFQKRGYVPVRRNTVPLGDVWLATTTVERKPGA